MNARRISLLTLSALPLLACTAPATEDVTAKSAPLLIAEPDVDFDPELVVAPPAPDLAVYTLERGDGWRRIRVAGQATDINTSALVAVDRELIVIEDKTKIATAPVAKFVKSEIQAELAAPKALFLAEGALPDGEDADIIDPVAAEQAEAAMNSGAPTAFFSCSSEEKTFSKSISKTYNVAHNKTTETGALTGKIDFNASLAASGTGKVVIKVHRSPWSLCLPYKVSFRRASFTGTANVVGRADIDATFEKAWKYDKKVAQPSLGSLSFAIGPVPVVINFSAPIHVGVEAAARATLKLDATGSARASLDVSCTTGGCSGSKSATYTFAPGTTPVVGANGKLDVTPYAYAGVHANLYRDWVAYAEIGVKAKVKGELWSYNGNTCGDGDYSGSNEFVTATALDTRIGIDLVAKAGVATSDKGPWTWNLLDRHAKFWELASSTAMAPMLNVRSNPLGSTTALATGRMRPCWPWSEKMQYRIDFNDGTSEVFWEWPSVAFSKVRNYGSYGGKLVSVTAIADTEGRTPGKTTNDSVYLRPYIFDHVNIGTITKATP